MAKEISRPDEFRETCRLAEQLFARFWTINSPTNERALAAMCFQGAFAFQRVAAQIREGRDPAEIVNPPAEVPITDSENTTVAV